MDRKSISIELNAIVARAPFLKGNINIGNSLNCCLFFSFSSLPEKLVNEQSFHGSKPISGREIFLFYPLDLPLIVVLFHRQEKDQTALSFCRIFHSITIFKNANLTIRFSLMLLNLGIIFFPKYQVPRVVPRK